MLDLPGYLFRLNSWRRRRSRTLWSECSLCHESAQQTNLWPTELHPANKRALFENKLWETLAARSQPGFLKIFWITRNDWPEVASTQEGGPYWINLERINLQGRVKGIGGRLWISIFLLTKSICLFSVQGLCQKMAFRLKKLFNLLWKIHYRKHELTSGFWITWTFFFIVFF